MPYPKPHNLTSLQDMFSYVNTVTDGLFAVMLVIVMFVIVFASSKLGGQSTAKAFIFSSFISFVITSFFWGAGIVAGKVMVVLLVLVVMSFVYFYIAQQTN